MKAAALIWALMTAPALAADCSVGTVDIRLSGGSLARFTVEVVDTPKARSQGLMFRTSMPMSAGMLFVYERPQHAVFWMKNTLIPLDMIFADETGLVTSVHSNAVPQDETGIDGGTGVKVVLEINGGLAKRMGIAPGAVMRHPALDQTAALWGCDAQ